MGTPINNGYFGMVDNKTGRQVRRYIRLTELIDPLLLKVNNCDRLKSYFPKEYTLKQCEELLWAILEEWKRKN